jgi:outer membrane protein assembly factor BamB
LRRSWRSHRAAVALSDGTSFALDARTRRTDAVTNMSLRRISFVILAGLMGSACARPASDATVVTTTRAATTLANQVSVMSADTLRSGWYPDQPLLDPLTVSSPYFGQVFDSTLDGQVFAQPLYASGVVFVATDSNWIYGLDPKTGVPLWRRQLATPWSAADVGCGNVAPDVGVTGTPAIDTTTSTAYLVSKTYANGKSGAAAYFAHAVDLTTGAERAGFPVAIAGAASNDPTQVFNPTYQLQRPGLLLMNGVVYAAFGSHCDLPPYVGWVAGISTKGQLSTLWTTEAGAARTVGGGIWMSGGGLVSDGDGQILFATGNDASTSTTPVPGHAPPGALGESIVRLVVQADGSLAATDFFAPAEAPVLNIEDYDLGAGAPVALPAAFGTASHPSLLVHAGKSGYLYLLDRDDLGGYLQGTGGTDRVLQRIGPYGGVWSKPSVWPGDGGYVYVPVAVGCTSLTDQAGCLRAYAYGATADGMPTLTAAAVSTSFFGYGSSAVVVTSDGTRSGSALLWTIWSSGGAGTTSQLRAYDAVPVAGALPLRFLAGVGGIGKFTAPAVGAGLVYVARSDGHLLGFGIAGAPALPATGTAFAPTLVGDTLVSNVEVTPSGAVDVLSLSASGDFALTDAAPAVPLDAATGDTIIIPVAFRPTSEGPSVGSLQLTTNRGTFTIALAGVGQSPAPELAMSPSVVRFAPLVMGKTATQTLTVTNVSGATVTLATVAPPPSPFSSSGWPAAGTSLPAGGSFTATLSFAPTSAGSASGTLALTTSDGAAVVAVEGVGLTGGRLRLAPTVLDLGARPIGDADLTTLQLTNAGDAPVVIQTSQPPTSAAFQVTTPLAVGTSLAPGASIERFIRISSLTVGPTTATWQIQADDGQGPQQLSMTISGVAPAVTTPSSTSSSSSSTKTTSPAGGELMSPTTPEAATPTTPAAPITGSWSCNASGEAPRPRLLGLGLLAVAWLASRKRTERRSPRQRPS